MQQHCNRLFARHAGALLFKKKPSSLFTIPNSLDAVRQLKKLAQCNGLKFFLLRYSEKSLLTLLYCPYFLAQTLEQNLPKRYLENIGYPESSDITACLQELRNRMTGSLEFPHEVGFFLGYPPADVVGFMLYKGKASKCQCMWKVYSNVNKAKKLSEEFRTYNHLCMKYVEEGGSLLSFKPAV